MNDSTTPKKSTTVRLPFPPGLLTGPLKIAPFLQKPVLTRLFLSPVRRTPGWDEAGEAIGTLRVGAGHVRVRARGRGPTVMLVHGWQGSAQHLKKVGERLVSGGFTVVSFDMPAHGETSGKMTSLPEFAETVTRAAELVGPVHGIVAHSLGATATALALSRGLHVGSALLVAPMISFDFALDEFAKMLHLTPAMREAAALGTERRVGITRREVDLLELDLPAMPLTLIHDRDDLRTPFVHSERLLQRWKGAKLLATNGLGHRRILDNEAVLNRIESELHAAPHEQWSPLGFTCAPEMTIDAD